MHTIADFDNNIEMTVVTIIVDSETQALGESG